ncbi:GAP family protein [Kocuria sp. CNJ-770]|uniref:GAP family protein n=1 Tax=Kocuria sp. CNJ-770 TaxID=1904964 RepID=UPI00096ACA8A|nr:GAP family protein [Kocuria sp. CNJ-770]
MPAATLASLPIAVGLLAASMPVAVLVLMLVTGGRRGAVTGFLLGWVAGIGAVAALTLAVIDTSLPRDDPAPWAGVLRIVLGAALLLLGLKQWRGRTRADTEPGRWMTAVDTMAPARALLVAFLLVAVNPKNAVLVVSGAAAIGTATSVVVHQVAALALFTLVASLGVAAPLLLRVALGDRADPVLAAAKAWMTANSALVMTVVLVVIGAVLLGNGLSGLRSG